jgi:hypothetical protein
MSLIPLPQLRAPLKAKKDTALLATDARMSKGPSPCLRRTWNRTATSESTLRKADPVSTIDLIAVHATVSGSGIVRYVRRLNRF